MFTKPPAFFVHSILFCVRVCVCVYVCLCVCVLNLSLMSHFHNGEWKQMTNVSPQKTWFVKPFVSEELALRAWNLEWGEGWIMSCRPLGRGPHSPPLPPRPPKRAVFCLNGFSGGINLPVYLCVSEDKSYTFSGGLNLPVYLYQRINPIHSPMSVLLLTWFGHCRIV